LLPEQRQSLAVEALAGLRPISQLAADYEVSRPFVYRQADKAEQALRDAFAPDLPADDRVLFWLPVTALWLRRLIVALLLLLCHSSYRGVHELLRDLFHYPLSLGSIHNVARAAMERACAHNARQDLSAVTIAANDEIFQALLPVLVGVDVASTYCYLLSQEEQRDGETWALRLLELHDRGFVPRALIGDAGTGMRAGQELALPQTPRRTDGFHVVQEVLPVVTFLENRAYQALAACAQLGRRQAAHEHRHGRSDSGLGQRLRHARPAAATADQARRPGAACTPPVCPVRRSASTVRASRRRSRKASSDHGQDGVSAGGGPRPAASCSARSGNAAAISTPSSAGAARRCTWSRFAGPGPST
jgi:hypothetical protein